LNSICRQKHATFRPTTNAQSCFLIIFKVFFYIFTVGVHFFHRGCIGRNFVPTYIRLMRSALVLFRRHENPFTKNCPRTTGRLKSLASLTAWPQNSRPARRRPSRPQPAGEPRCRRTCPWQRRRPARRTEVRGQKILRPGTNLLGSYQRSYLRNNWTRIATKICLLFAIYSGLTEVH
jgi:hypothetical protein